MSLLCEISSIWYSSLWRRIHQPRRVKNRRKSQKQHGQFFTFCNQHELTNQICWHKQYALYYSLWMNIIFALENKTTEIWETQIVLEVQSNWQLSKKPWPQGISFHLCYHLALGIITYVIIYYLLSSSVLSSASIYIINCDIICHFLSSSLLSSVTCHHHLCYYLLLIIIICVGICNLFMIICAIIYYLLSSSVLSSVINFTEKLTMLTSGIFICQIWQL